jgi:L-rhamnose mutarotase
MQKYCLALDLKDDPKLIAEYEAYHKKIWPEIDASIKNSGITNLEIYRIGTRLFMILEANDTFSFEKKDKMDADNPKVQEWETLMWHYQQALPHGTSRDNRDAKAGEKWLLMDKVFQL